VDVIIIWERVRTCDETENKMQYREVVESKILPFWKIYGVRMRFFPKQGHYNIHRFKFDHCRYIIIRIHDRIKMCEIFQ